MIAWLTTYPNPRVRAYGENAGQRGWRLHAVRVETGQETHRELRRLRALCGVFPAHGWGLDMFVDEECDRCWRAVEKAGDETAMEALRKLKSGR